MKTVVVAALLLFLVVSASAQTFTEAHGPVEYNPKIFWTEVGVAAAANAFDGYTTIRNIQMYSWCREVQNPLLYGSRPGIARYSVVSSAIGAGSAVVAYRLQHSDKAYLRVLGHATVWAYTYTHLKAGIGNTWSF